MAPSSLVQDWGTLVAVAAKYDDRSRDGPAQWYWELKQWKQCAAEGSPTEKEFDPKSTKKLEAAYQQFCTGGAHSFKLVLGATEYKIDMRNMIMLNAKTAFMCHASCATLHVTRKGEMIPQTRPLAAA